MSDDSNGGAGSGTFIGTRLMLLFAYLAALSAIGGYLLLLIFRGSRALQEQQQVTVLPGAPGERATDLAAKPAGRSAVESVPWSRKDLDSDELSLCVAVPVNN